jgi:hypothetical protein
MKHMASDYFSRSVKPADGTPRRNRPVVISLLAAV